MSTGLSASLLMSRFIPLPTPRLVLRTAAAAALIAALISPSELQGQMTHPAAATAADAAIGVPAPNLLTSVDTVYHPAVQAAAFVGGALVGGAIGVVAGWATLPRGPSCFDCGRPASVTDRHIVTGLVVGAVVGGIVGLWLTRPRIRPDSTKPNR